MHIFYFLINFLNFFLWPACLTTMFHLIAYVRYITVMSETMLYSEVD